MEDNSENPPDESPGTQMPDPPAPLIEALAKSSHDVRARKQSQDPGGQRRGHGASEVDKRDPSRISWEELFESEKSADRESAAEIIGRLSKLGFEFCSRSSGCNRPHGKLQTMISSLKMLVYSWEQYAGKCRQHWDRDEAKSYEYASEELQRVVDQFKDRAK